MNSETSSLDHVFSTHPQGVVLAVLVVPGASRSEIVGIHGDALRVRVAAPPEGGRANKTIAMLLERAFSCRVDLLSGARSRRKRMLLRGVDLDAATATITSVLR